MAWWLGPGDCSGGFDGGTAGAEGGRTTAEEPEIRPRVTRFPRTPPEKTLEKSLYRRRGGILTMAVSG